MRNSNLGHFKNAIDSALTGYFFPTYSYKREKIIPEIFDSSSFTLERAEKIDKHFNEWNRTNRGKKYGFDFVKYIYGNRSFRKQFGIYNPLAYFRLVRCLFDNKNNILLNNNILEIAEEPTDEDISSVDFIIEYKEEVDSRRYNFRAKFKIDDIFSNIYTHAIPWALVSIEKAKANRENSEWFNKIDQAIRNCHNGETNGITGGYFTSQIIAEIILTKVDSELINYKYTREFDCYQLYYNSEVEFINFRKDFINALSKYKLNFIELGIEDYPFLNPDEWKMKIDMFFIDGAIKYFNNIASQIDSRAFIFNELVKIYKNDNKDSCGYFLSKIKNHKDIIGNISTAGFLADLLLVAKFGFNDFDEILNIAKATFVKNMEGVFPILISRGLENGFHNQVLWGIYFLTKCDITISSDIANKIIESNDCLSILMLYINSKDYQDDIICFLNNIAEYEVDKYWLLRYQLFYDGLEFNMPEYEKVYFDLLKNEGVSFLKEINPFSITKLGE